MGAVLDTGIEVQLILLNRSIEKVQQVHSSFRHVEAWPVNRAHAANCGLNQQTGVRRGLAQRHYRRSAVLRLLDAVGAGVHEDRYLARNAVLPSEFLGCSLGEFSDSLDEILKLRHWPSEAPGTRDLLLGRRDRLHVDARHILQLAHGAFEHYAPTRADHEGAAEGVIVAQPAAHSPSS